MRLAFVMTAVLALTACAEDPVRVGSKDFAENRVLAEMFALLIEGDGMPVDRQIPLGDTATVFEALRTGEIDVYPEYTGTGLALLGLPPTADLAASRERVAEEVARLGITVLEPLGFESTYAVVVEPELAQDADVAEVADLAPIASDLRLAVADEFASRPEVGLQAFLDRFGIDFQTVQIVPEEERRSVYDLLIDDRSDVVVGFGTDPEIAAYGLTVLDDGGEFFPNYAAVPVVSWAALARHPEIASALGTLAGRLDEARMRELNNAVAVEGRAPRDVAREALAALGLLDVEADVLTTPFLLAVDPAEIGEEMTNQVLRAARGAVEGRGVELLGAEDPVGAIFDRRARIALAPAIAQFEIEDGSARRIAELETIAAVGSYFLHVLAPSGGSSALVEAGRIAAGPPGTPSYKLASAVAAQPEPPAEVVPLESTSAAAAVQAVASGAADAAIVLAPLGETNLAAALEESTGVGLASGADWWTGAARVGLPFFHEAVIPPSTYGTEAVPTLAMQATLIGPAPSNDVLGAQGPSTYSDDLRPVTDQAVLAFNRNLGPHPDVGRYLRSATALTPQVGRVERALNRTPGYTVLSLGIVLFLAWAGWLLARPAKAERGG